MKKICFLLIPFVLILSTCEKKDNGPNPDDPVNIPDPSFLEALLAEGVDTNGDSIISYAEAEAVTELFLITDAKGLWCDIADMTGIEAFINLDSLSCCGDYPVELDLSKNTKLVYLACHLNGIKELDLSKNTKLKYLDCSFWCNAMLGACGGEGSLETINISNSILLEHLICGGQKLKSLDISNNTALIELSISGNLLTSLDISGNISLKTIDLWENVYLNEVCVWTMPFPPEGVEVIGVSTDIFTTDCSK